MASAGLDPITAGQAPALPLDVGPPPSRARRLRPTASLIRQRRRVQPVAPMPPIVQDSPLRLLRSLTWPEARPSVGNGLWVMALFAAGVFVARQYAAQIEQVLAGYAAVGIGIFLASSVMAVLLPLLGNLPLVPATVLAWGPWWTAGMLLSGWIVGAALAFLLGRHAVAGLRRFGVGLRCLRALGVARPPPARRRTSPGLAPSAESRIVRDPRGRPSRPAPRHGASPAWACCNCVGLVARVATIRHHHRRTTGADYCDATSRAVSTSSGI